MVRIEAVEDIDPVEWNVLISADPSSSPFHTREWLMCLSTTYPHWEVGAIICRGRQTIAAAVPFVKRRVSGVVLLESLPFGGSGGLIRSDAAFDGGHLIERFFSDTGAALSMARLVDTSGRPPGRWKDVARSKASTVLDLSLGYDVISARYRANVRKNLRHAHNSEVLIEPVSHQSSIETFRDLARYAYRLHSSALPYGLELYESIARLLVPAGRATFELAYKDGSAVAGSLHLIGAHEMLNWLTPAYRESQALRANTLLIDNAIRLGIAAGLKTYNLGESQGSEGLERFKRAWGGYEREYYVIERMSPPVALASRVRAVLRSLRAVKVGRK
jgi:hypothetical protein